jgi:hypothetical protein
MGILDSDLIRPLELAENNYLQVLLSRFSLTRRGMGAELNLRFDARTPTIWLRQAKSYLNKELRKSPEKIERYKEELNRFLISGQGTSYEFDDPDFPFRYGSGGTLPVIKIGVQQYYCLFYREVHPVGWNIANGGCDSRQELLNPWETVERELREELIVIDPKLKLRYLLDPHEHRTVDHPDFATAWRLWQPRFQELNFPRFKKSRLLAGWLGGPDSLRVQFDSREPVASRGCFLNINAEDFGIEIDRVAKLALDEGAILCDGEAMHGCLQNRPIGLFEVERFSEAFVDGSTRFVPQWIFYNARRRVGAELVTITEQYRNYLKDLKVEMDTEDFQRAEKDGREYDLCPVTRSLVARILQTEPPSVTRVSDPAAGPCEVFISFASEDAHLARSVYQYLVSKTTKRIFFSEETKRHADFGREIDEALDSANCLITVASSREHLMKEWVKFEWDGYHRDILSGRKRNAELLSVIFGFDPRDLPRALRFYEALVFDQREPNASLDKLLRFIQ